MDILSDKDVSLSIAAHRPHPPKMRSDTLPSAKGDAGARKGRRGTGISPWAQPARLSPYTGFRTGRLLFQINKRCSRSMIPRSSYSK